MNRCGCDGAAVRWCDAHDRSTTLHDYLSMPAALRDYLWEPSRLRLRRDGRDSSTTLHRAMRCGRGRTGVRRFAAHDRSTTLRA
jgi:hypothetical protein